VKGFMLGAVMFGVALGQDIESRSNPSNKWHAWNSLNASPAQQLTALLKAIGLWRENV
jgi:hypothetical protein